VRFRCCRWNFLLGIDVHGQADAGRGARKQNLPARQTPLKRMQYSQAISESLRRPRPTLEAVRKRSTRRFEVIIIHVLGTRKDRKKVQHYYRGCSSFYSYKIWPSSGKSGWRTLISFKILPDPRSMSVREAVEIIRQTMLFVRCSEILRWRG